MNHGENEITLYELRKQHPQLTEKAIVDYVNGLEVLDDHLRFRNQINNSFLTRIWDSITARTAQRQQVIDINFTTALKTVSVWLQDIQLSQADSDIAIAHIAKKLRETRAGLMGLQQRHQELAEKVEAIDQSLEIFQIQVDNRFTELESRIQQVDARTLASTHLEQVFDKWQAGRLNTYPLLARLYLVIDELHWGDFGTYCRSRWKSSEVDNFIEQLVNKACSQMRQDLKGDISEITLSKEWLSPIIALPKELREVLGYLTDWASPQTTPVTWTIRNTALAESSVLTPNKIFPGVFSGQHAINHLMYEHKRRMQISYDY
ncbi:hypothetical protein F7734_05495 [Scytonema sp. UIC 10036]|uniref:diguanylate cyclase regulator RdcB family protein n=1 Tax=Scytonema sp. UIC 10036 TaxID=2304196 RepID=UPI0012DA5641|nr:diguanylate cyclase regulator RdcB family protein [Scytonema sp. UIC 10036]MUG91944.1 hypothetical protein [Scytonema sp. UIC 10036]